MYKRWVIALLTLLCATATVYAAHFRGAVIMVSPKHGGAANEVSY